MLTAMSGSMAAKAAQKSVPVEVVTPADGNEVPGGVGRPAAQTVRPAEAQPSGASSLTRVKLSSMVPLILAAGLILNIRRQCRRWLAWRHSLLLSGIVLTFLLQTMQRDLSG